MLGNAGASVEDHRKGEAALRPVLLQLIPSHIDDNLAVAPGALLEIFDLVTGQIFTNTIRGIEFTSGDCAVYLEWR